jgi:hypothetical protein
MKKLTEEQYQSMNNTDYLKLGGAVGDCQILDKVGKAKIDPESIRKLTECIRKLDSTKSLHTDSNGNYTEERKALHRKILKKFRENVVCIESKKPLAIIMGGSPASGKSTFLRRYRPFLLDDEIMKVDADELRAELPEYKGYNASATHIETTDLVETLLSDRSVIEIERW